MLNRTHVAVGLLCIATMYCWLGAAIAEAADPAKAPLGWGDLKFGMTPTEVLEKLGPVAAVARPEPERPLMLRDKKTPDVRAALEMAKGIAAAAGPNEKTPKAAAAKEILDLVKHRAWKGRPQHALPTESPIRNISGELEQISENSHQMVTQYVVIRVKNKRAAPVVFPRDSLDEKSKDYLKEVERAVYDLTELLMDDERKARDAMPLDPRLMRIRAVVVRDITLVPEVMFTDGKLSGISLATPGSDNPTTPYNTGWPGIYRALCEELSDKYGPPDEEGRGDVGTTAKWRFPDCQISCLLHRFGVEVGYRKLDEAGLKSDGL